MKYFLMAMATFAVVAAVVADEVELKRVIAICGFACIPLGVYFAIRARQFLGISFFVLTVLLEVFAMTMPWK